MATETFDMFTLQEMLQRMSLAQWKLFLSALDDVMDEESEYGTVTLVVKRGRIRFIEPTKRIVIPYPVEDRK